MFLFLPPHCRHLRLFVSFSSGRVIQVGTISQQQRVTSAILRSSESKGVGKGRKTFSLVGSNKNGTPNLIFNGHLELVAPPLEPFSDGGGPSSFP